MSLRSPMPWRGASNRLYPVSTDTLDAGTVLPAYPALLLAITRAKDGIAHIRDLALSDTLSPDWLSRARSSGATELHVYALQADDDPHAVLDDLLPEGIARPAKRTTRRAA